MEEIVTNENGQVSPISLEYNDYRDELKQMYFLGVSDDNISIMSSFNVLKDAGVCINQVAAVKNGEETSLETTMRHRPIKSMEFEYNDVFINSFLEPMLLDYIDINEVTNINSLVNVDEKTNMASINIDAPNNNSLSINGLSIDVANKLANYVTIKMLGSEMTDEKAYQFTKKLPNENGIGNTSILIAVLFLIGLTTIGTIYFTIMANR